MPDIVVKYKGFIGIICIPQVFLCHRPKFMLTKPTVLTIIHALFVCPRMLVYKL